MNGCPRSRWPAHFRVPVRRPRGLPLALLLVFSLVLLLASSAVAKADGSGDSTEPLATGSTVLTVEPAPAAEDPAPAPPERGDTSTPPRGTTTPPATPPPVTPPKPVDPNKPPTGTTPPPVQPTAPTTGPGGGTTSTIPGSGTGSGASETKPTDKPPSGGPKETTKPSPPKPAADTTTPPRVQLPPTPVGSTPAAPRAPPAMAAKPIAPGTPKVAPKPDVWRAAPFGDPTSTFSLGARGHGGSLLAASGKLVASPLVRGLQPPVALTSAVAGTHRPVTGTPGAPADADSPATHHSAGGKAFRWPTIKVPDPVVPLTPSAPAGTSAAGASAAAAAIAAIALLAYLALFSIPALPTRLILTPRSAPSSFRLTTAPSRAPPAS